LVLPLGQTGQVVAFDAGAVGDGTGALGGGLAHIRLADGRHTIVDGISTAPAAARADMYQPLSDKLPDYRETRDRANVVGSAAVAVPGALAAWCLALERFGTLPLAEVV
ncbi:gamma-glutamyltransferase, partial [Enterobacter hormaechei]|uniref:gamma-glutamyltransferase n=1 Tax=Enterobacter hormaechei TaxID=158836 RepID=UPI00195365F5